MIPPLKISTGVCLVYPGFVRQSLSTNPIQILIMIQSLFIRGRTCGLRKQKVNCWVTYVTNALVGRRYQLIRHRPSIRRAGSDKLSTLEKVM